MLNHTQRLELIDYLLSSDTAFDLTNCQDKETREFISKLYRISHPAFNCKSLHKDWDREAEQAYNDLVKTGEIKPQK